VHQISEKVHDTVMLARVREIAATRCTGWGGSLLEFNGEADHVHLLVALPPNLDLSRFVNNLKTTSSRLLRKEFAERLKRVYRKPVLHHHVWWGAIDPETVYRATKQPRRELGALHLQPSTSRALPGALGAEGVVLHVDEQQCRLRWINRSIASETVHHRGSLVLAKHI
jgi:hypothetical protein